jgi:hypothetical protein
MYKINNYMFVFYWRAMKEDTWLISQPISLGELIDGEVEFSFNDGSSLPVHDIDWCCDEILVTTVPPRTYNDNVIKGDNR